MEKKNFLRFFILWVMLCQGFSFLLNNRTEDSSDHLVRKRRVVDRTPNANTQTRLRDTYYVVNIKKNGNHACAGSILAAQIILTTVTCIEDHARYSVVSGTLSTISGGISHLVTGILRHPAHEFPLIIHDIALLSINPPITFGENINRPIPIFQSNSGQLPANTIVTVSGYGRTVQNRRGGLGCIGPGHPRLIDPHELQQIRLPTISRQECRHRNNNNPYITNGIICTFHERKFCSSGELGNPLVYNGYLAGILVVDGFYRDCDLFVSVALPEHRNWILTHMSPEHIPRYIPPPASPPPHQHNNPQDCSRIHPCDEEDGAH